MALELVTEHVDQVAVVRCKGRILFGADATTLEAHVRSLLPETPRIVLNLEKVDYIDSAGQGVLVGLLTAARGAGGSLRLATVPKRILDLLHVSMLTRLIEVYETEAEAIAHSQGKSGQGD